MKLYSKKELLKKQYEYFGESNNPRFRAYGSDLISSFKNAAVALFNIVTPIKKVSPEKKKSLKIYANNERALLYDFLEELIFFFDSEGYIPAEFTSFKINDVQEGFSLEAEVLGDDAIHYDVKHSLKGITYNDILIAKDDGFVIIQVVLEL